MNVSLNMEWFMKELQFLNAKYFLVFFSILKEAKNYSAGGYENTNQRQQDTSLVWVLKLDMKHQYQKILISVGQKSLVRLVSVLVH